MKNEKTVEGQTEVGTERDQKQVYVKPEMTEHDPLKPAFNTTTIG